MQVVTVALIGRIRQEANGKVAMTGPDNLTVAHQQWWNMSAIHVLEFTVAAAALLVDQMTVCPVITFPSWSFTVATRAVVVPASIDADGGATVTVVTTGATAVTVIADVPDLPELVAVIVAEPAATPDTTPLEFTVAAAALLVVHVTVWPVMGLPF